MIRVLVAVAFAQDQDVVAVDLVPGSTLADALVAARVRERHPGIALDRVGVWGRRREPGHVLRDGDRVEIYRAIRADAKVLRRARAGLRTSTRSRSAP